MKISMGGLIAVLGVGCGGADVILMSNEPYASTREPVALAADARVGLRVNFYRGHPMPEGMTIASSDDAVVTTAVAPDAKTGIAVMQTGKPGKATLTLRDPAAHVVDTMDVVVRTPGRLVPQYPQYKDLGHAVANEVASLRILVEDADGVRLFGAGAFVVSVGGTGGLTEGPLREGVERLYLTGKPGQAPLTIVLGTISVDATVVFYTPTLALKAPKKTVVSTCTAASPPGCRDTRDALAVTVEVTEGTGIPLAGGQCAWTLTGGATIARDESAMTAMNLRTDASDAWARTTTFFLPTGPAPATATCTLGGQSATVTLR